MLAQILLSLLALVNAVDFGRLVPQSKKRRLIRTGAPISVHRHVLDRVNHSHSPMPVSVHGELAEKVEQNIVSHARQDSDGLTSGRSKTLHFSVPDVWHNCDKTKKTCLRWVPIMKLTGDRQTVSLGYSAKLWTDSSTFRPGSELSRAEDAKYNEFNTVPFKVIRMCTQSDPKNDATCFQKAFDTEYADARKLFSAGYIATTDMDQAKILQLFEGTGAKNCDMMKPGFNVECKDGNKVRWGYCNNIPEQSCGDGGDADAVIGIGLAGQSQRRRGQMGAGYTCYWKTDACTESSHKGKNVWLFVETEEEVKDCAEAPKEPLEAVCKCDPESDRHDCAIGKFCYEQTCNDEAKKDKCTNNGEQAVEKKCMCALESDEEECDVGKYCYNDICHDNPAILDCNATDKVLNETCKCGPADNQTECATGKYCLSGTCSDTGPIFGESGAVEVRAAVASCTAYVLIALFASAA